MGAIRVDNIADMDHHRRLFGQQLPCNKVLMFRVSETAVADSAVTQDTEIERSRSCSSKTKIPTTQHCRAADEGVVGIIGIGTQTRECRLIKRVRHR